MSKILLLLDNYKINMSTVLPDRSSFILTEGKDTGEAIIDFRVCPPSSDPFLISMHTHTHKKNAWFQHF